MIDVLDLAIHGDSQVQTEQLNPLH